MTVENISWSISTKECCRPRRGLNPRPPGLQSDGASNWATETNSYIDVLLYITAMLGRHLWLSHHKGNNRDWNSVWNCRPWSAVSRVCLLHHIRNQERFWIHVLTFSMLVKNQQTTFWIFSYFSQENRFWHFVHIVSNGNNLHLMSKPVLLCQANFVTDEIIILFHRWKKITYPVKHNVKITSFRRRSDVESTL